MLFKVELKMTQFPKAEKETDVALKINTVKIDPSAAGICAVGLIFNKV
jgi:hypothetical protein